MNKPKKVLVLGSGSSNIKKFWIRLKYWQRGSIMGFIVGFIVGLITILMLLNILLVPNFLLYILHPIMYISYGIGFELQELCDIVCSKSYYDATWISTYVLIYSLIGALIGLIIGKVKKK